MPGTYTNGTLLVHFGTTWQYIVLLTFWTKIGVSCNSVHLLTQLLHSALTESQMGPLTNFQLAAFKKKFPLTANTADADTCWEELTPHQRETLKKEERRDKARTRMAKKRAEVRALDPEAQEAFLQKEREYKATYREKKAEQRRNKLIVETFGPKELGRRRVARIKKRLARDIKEGRRDPHPDDLGYALDDESDVYPEEDLPCSAPLPC
ncbi:hypothetical protein C8R43DRAFT_953679 [Mycena crocata]|nr:hypothetical protein C8R43DRAFT_953679 [Mycena crocata]